MFDTYGQCFFGILCRSGQSHIDPLTGINIINPTGNYLESLNKYPPLLKHFLRRKKYDYTLADRLVKMANKQITKANIAKRNTEEEKSNENHHDVGEKEDRSLVDIYYSTLKTNQDEVKFSQCFIRSNALMNFKNSCGERDLSLIMKFFSRISIEFVRILLSMKMLK